MKRFFAVVTGAAAALLGLWLGVYSFGWYVDFRPGAPVDVAFRAAGGALEQKGADGKYRPLALRAVDLSASLPGHPSADGAPTKADYSRWLGWIGEMGANTVQLDTLLDADFYNALYDYNTSHSTPLFLLQGISVSDEANYGAGDGYGPGFSEKLIRDGKTAVDGIHGRRNAAGAAGAVEFYRRDVSPWTLGYLVGYSWNSDTVSYTDHNTTRPTAYRGAYLSAGENASRFEVMLAEVLDQIVSYEAGKYKEMRLISFANDPANDPFAYAELYDRQLPKFSRIDGEHLVQQGYSGLFAAYRLYDFCDDPIGCFSARQKADCAALLKKIDRKGAFGGYLQLLRSYHSLPVYVMGYGYSTARVPVSQAAPLTEKQQGERLVSVWREAVGEGCAGVCISGWQDAWERRTWNTAFAAERTRAPFWHDLQSDGQNYGLLAFAPGKETSVCVLDGDPKEWSREDVALEAESRALSLRYDAEGLYLMISGKGAASQPLYLPIGFSEEVGADSCDKPKLAFSHKANFLLCVDGAKHSRLLVQDRCDAALENFGVEAGKGNPFLGPPAAGSPVFSVSWLPVDRHVLLSKTQMETLDRTQLAKARQYGVWSTGRLTAGCGDPAAADYDSRADICFGEDCVELRLPWLLLNVSDPSQMWRHGDYYADYGVKSQPFGGGWIGLGAGEETIEMAEFSLRGWGDRPEYRERLKQSYGVVQKAWKEAAK